MAKYRVIKFSNGRWAKVVAVRKYRNGTEVEYIRGGNNFVWEGSDKVFTALTISRKYTASQFLEDYLS